MWFTGSPAVGRRGARRAVGRAARVRPASSPLTGASTDAGARYAGRYAETVRSSGQPEAPREPASRRRPAPETPTRGPVVRAAAATASVAVQHDVAARLRHVGAVGAQVEAERARRAGPGRGRAGARSRRRRRALAASPRQVDALDDLAGAQQHGRRRCRSGSRDDVDAVVQAEVPVDVQAARLGEHHRVARGAAAEGVRARVVGAAVGLDLGEPERDVAVGRARREVGAEQVARDREHVAARTRRAPGRPRARAASAASGSRAVPTGSRGHRAARRPASAARPQAVGRPVPDASSRTSARSRVRSRGEVRGLVGHPRQPVRPRVRAVAREAARRAAGRRGASTQTRSDRAAASTARRRRRRSPRATSTSGTGTSTQSANAPGGPVVALVAARRRPRRSGSRTCATGAARARPRGPTSPRRGRRGARRAAGGRAAPPSAAASVVLPEPAGPSTRRADAARAVGGATRSERGRRARGGARAARSPPSVRRQRPELRATRGRAARLELLGDADRRRAAVRRPRGAASPRR